MIIDCFTYYNEEELLELRVNLLKDHVDGFIIMEGDMSYTGIPKEFTCKKTIEKLGLPSDKIRVIEVNLPKDDECEITEQDRIYSGKSCTTEKSNRWSSTRERLTRDSITSVVDEYSDDAVFIFSDCDEIIKPSTVDFFASMARQHKELGVIKIPMIQLEGRADLRLYNAQTGEPEDCNDVMMVCTKSHFKKANPFGMRFSLLSPYPNLYLTQDGAPIKDCAWHFTWMGDANRKILKMKSFSHHADNVQSAIVPDFSSEEMVKFLQEHKVAEGTVNPWGNTKCVMKKYPISELPSIIFDLPRVKKFLLGEEKVGLNFSTESWTENKPVLTIEQRPSIPVIGTAVVNGVHWLKRMIASIDYPVDELFVINNNGRGELHDELQAISKTKHDYINKITVTHMPSNIGCGGAWNLIIRSYLNAPYWIITNPDVAYSPGFLQTMVKEAMDEEVGLVHCSPCYHNQGSFECFLIKDWVVQSHGLFDENFYPAYVEDCDYIMRLVLQPVKRVYMNAAYLHGEESYESTGSQVLRTEPALKEKIDKARYMNEHTYMEQKWGPKWRYPEPWPHPFNNSNFPISYTTYDLNFCREKCLGF